MLFRIQYLPPLLIYASAGVSSLTNIVGLFFLKDYLDLSAAFIASIGFWAGIPWALKMPIGFIVDKFWSFKNLCERTACRHTINIYNLLLSVNIYD